MVERGYVATKVFNAVAYIASSTPPILEWSICNAQVSLRSLHFFFSASEKELVRYWHYWNMAANPIVITNSHTAWKLQAKATSH